MQPNGFAVELDRRLDEACADGVPPWLPRIPWRTRGCERRLRFIETQLAAWVAAGRAQPAWRALLASGAVAPRAQASRRGQASIDTSFIAQHTRDAGLGLDAAGHVRRHNSAAPDLLGVAPECLLGRHARTLLRRDDRAAFMSALAQATAGGEVELDSRLCDGSAVRLALRHHADHGGFTLVISPQRALNVGVLAAIGHELRSPLGVTLTWLELLLAETPACDDRATRGLRAIERSARLQQRLIDDILDVARSDCGAMQVELAPLDFSEQCAAAAAAFEPKARAAGIALRAQVTCGLVVEADAARVQQLLQNLLDNALKFTPRGGHVRLSVSKLEGCAVLEVSDDGRGIDAALLPRVFDPYEQGERGSKRAAGLGLGLAIAKRISELHHGELSVESAGLGRGATFRWRLLLLPGGAA